MKNGILVAATFRNGTKNGYKNMGDYIQSLAGETFFEVIDEYIDREKLAKYTSNVGEVRVIMNAWYMRFPENWPPSEDIKPFLISIHISPSAEVKMLSSAGIDYLIKYGPVGCRDTGTLDLLERYNIPCYFSGCLTLTLGERYKTFIKKNTVLFVDPYFELIKRSNVCFSLILLLKILCYGMKNVGKLRILSKIFFHRYIMGRFKKIKRFLSVAAFYKTYSTWFDDDLLFNAEYISHQVRVGDGTCLKTEKEKIEYARNLIKKYAEASLVITSRIHCALPCLGLETPVLFITSRRLELKETSYARNRFGGLIDLFRVMRYDNFSLSTDDVTINKKITRDTRIINKGDYVPVKDELLRRCYKFLSRNSLPSHPPLYNN